MRTDLSNLVNDLYSVLGKQEVIEEFEKHTQEFGHNLSQTMKNRLLARSDASSLRMSNIGRPDRQLWYDINFKGNREELPPQTLIKFAYGDLIESFIIYLLKVAGYAVEDEQREIILDGIKGHIDFRIGNTVIDVKSASTFSFQKFESGALLEAGNDPFGYVAQLAGYVEAVSPGSDGAFLAVDKTLGKITLLVVPAQLLAKFRVRDRIVHIKDVVSSPVIPARCYDDVEDGKSGNRKLGVGCSYCSYKFHCWDNLKTYYFSTGPRYLTKIMREPRVSEFPPNE